MELEKIKGNTYYINAPTNIGVYIYKNKNCLLFDTGINNSHARKIDEILIKNGLHPKYIINTHSHIDHCGGNTYFQSTYPGCLVYASEAEKLFMENPELYNTVLFSASPIKELDVSTKALKIDFVLENGITKINDEKFEIIPLAGHSSGQAGVITPEKVCFAGDAVFCEAILDKYKFPYLFDIEKSISAMKSLKEVDSDFFVIGHSDKIFERSDFLLLIDKNLSIIEKFIHQLLELLDQPLTREDILESLTVLNDITLDFKQYYRNLSSVSAFIKYLDDKELLDYSVENGKLYFFKK